MHVETQDEVKIARRGRTFERREWQGLEPDSAETRNHLALIGSHNLRPKMEGGGRFECLSSCVDALQAVPAVPCCLCILQRFEQLESTAVTGLWLRQINDCLLT